jgi:hypothetical protein
MFNIDEFIPNFTLFLFVLAPTILIFLFVMVLLSRWMKRKPGKGKSWAELIGYIPMIYLISPIIEIYQYFIGERDDMIQRLFGYHFPIMMFLIVCVGIGQVSYYWVSMGPAGEVSD